MRTVEWFKKVGLYAFADNNKRRHYVVWSSVRPLTPVSRDAMSQ